MTGRHVSALDRVTNPCRRRAATVASQLVVGIALLAVIGIGSAPWVRAADKPTPKEEPLQAKIGDLAWIEGHWASKFGPNELDEIWSHPAGECMMASFRWIKNGKIWMYELMTMAEEDTGIALRFKHFSRALHGWEEKDEAITLMLVELDNAAGNGSKLAAFQNPGDGGPTWLVFHRESPTRMTVRVGSSRDGGADGLEIKYEKKR